MEIKEKSVFITGANRGIGKAVANRFSQDHCHLHLCVRKKDLQLEDEMKTAGALSVTSWEADLANTESLATLIKKISSEKIDVLFNNAGLLTGGLLEAQPAEDIQKMFQVNVISLVLLTRAVLPGMISRGSGKIINNASVSAFMHFPCASTYAASKSAVAAFSDCIEAEVKGTGVSTLCLVTPGIKTQMFDDIEKKYSQNIDIPQESISTKQYAEMIHDAVLHDETYLLPGGATGLGLAIARYLPPLFRWEIRRRFKR